MKRFRIRFFLMACLTALLGGGCSQSDKASTDTANKAVGRYIEIDVPLPEEIQNRNLRTIAILRNEENNEIEIYTNNNEDEFRKYTLTRNGNWYSKELDWKERFGDYEKLNTLAYGLDGNLYAHLLVNENISYSKNRFLRMDAQGNVTALCDSPQDIWNISREGETIQGFTALKDGSIVIHYADSKKTVVYNDKTHKVWMRFDQYSNHIPRMGEHTISVIEKTRNEVGVYSLENGENEYTVKYSDNYMGGNDLLYYKEGKGTYLFNSDGIHYLAEKAFLWETLLEGKMASMGMPIMEIKDVFMGKGDDFYVYYESSEINANNGTRLKHYVYDENSPISPNQVLTIYSLYENDLVNQAIGYFQNENPGVYINYRVVVPNRSKIDVRNRKNILTDEEYVRILDKEIMEGDSADIILCDKLPIQKYMDQGILSDVGNLLGDMLVSDEIFPLVTQCYKWNNSVYAVPLRFEVYTLLGDKDVVRNAGHLRRLIDYVKESGYPNLIAMDMDWQGMTDSFYYLYAHEFLNRDGRTFKKDRLAQFLKKIMEMEKLKSKENQYGISNYFSSSVSLKEYTLEKSKVANTSIRNILDFRKLEGVLEYRDGEMIQSKAYKPLSTVAIHEKSGNKELAGEFVKMLLSSKVQEQRYLNDAGIAVNQRAFSEWLHLNEVWNVEIYNYDAEDEVGNKLNEFIHIPSMERKNFYLEWFRSLEVPLLSDEENLKRIKEEARGFFKGRMTAEEVAVAIVERMAMEEW